MCKCNKCCSSNLSIFILVCVCVCVCVWVIIVYTRYFLIRLNWEQSEIIAQDWDQVLGWALSPQKTERRGQRYSIRWRLLMHDLKRIPLTYMNYISFKLLSWSRLENWRQTMLMAPNHFLLSVMNLCCKSFAL